MVCKNYRETGIPSLLIPTLHNNKHLLFRQHRLLAWLNKQRSTFDVIVLGIIEMTPHAEMDYFQDNVKHQGGCEFCDNNSNIFVTILVVFRNAHFKYACFLIIQNIITTFYSQQYKYAHLFYIASIDNIILATSRYITMKVDQDYQRLVTEIQQLKKTCNNQKLSHQSTIDQLQVSYDLNQELQNVIKSQAVTINTLKEQIIQKTNRLAEMGTSYQTQLLELKEFVVAKDRQLQGIRGSLNVTDYDMIRLRVISQLELVHRQKIQQLNKQIQRLSKLLSDQKQTKDICNQKLQYLKKQFERQIQEYQHRAEEKQKKYVRQSNKIYQKYQNQRISKKQMEKALQAAQKRYQNLVQKYDTQMNKAYELTKQPLHITGKSSIEYERTQVNRQTRWKQNLQQKEKEVQNLKKRLQKQASRNLQTITDLQQKLKDAKQGTITYQQHLQKIRQKQKDHEDIVSSLQKKIRNLKQDHSQQIRKVYKQCDRKMQQMRQKIKIEKQNYSKNIVNIDSPFKNFQQKNSITDRSEKQKSLQQRIRVLQNENNLLKKQTKQRQTKIERVEHSKTVSRGQSVQIYRIKLNEANQQIVSLLKDKVSLKQQISQIKR